MSWRLWRYSHGSRGNGCTKSSILCKRSVRGPSITDTNIVNSLRLRQNGRHFPDDIFKCIFLNESIWISFEISLKCVPKGPINKIPALVQIMAWRRPGDKPLSEPMLVCLLTHVYASLGLNELKEIVKQIFIIETHIRIYTTTFQHNNSNTDWFIRQYGARLSLYRKLKHSSYVIRISKWL